MSVLKKDDIIKACADAYRTASGTTDLVPVGELEGLISALTAGGGSGEVYLEQGSFVKEQGVTPVIPCPFEPNIIILMRHEGLNTAGDVAGIFRLTVIKDILTSGIIISSDGNTKTTNGTNTYLVDGYGVVGISYADGIVSLAATVTGRKLTVGYTYDYIFGRLGYNDLPQYYVQ